MSSSDSTTPVPSSSAAPASPGPKLEGEALLNALKAQLEFYFSRDNLLSDTYLLSQMNAAKYVSIDVICNFRKVKSLTEDKQLILTVMKQCKNMTIDPSGTMVKPNVKSERTTLILRDIASSTPANEIKGIFEASGCPGKVVAVKSDIGDTWYVTFENEDQCVDTALWLSSQTFQGKPVAARVKSENLFRNLYANAAAPNAPAQAQETGAPFIRGPTMKPIPGPGPNPYSHPMYGYNPAAAGYYFQPPMHWQGPPGPVTGPIASPNNGPKGQMPINAKRPGSANGNAPVPASGSPQGSNAKGGKGKHNAGSKPQGMPAGKAPGVTGSPSSSGRPGSSGPKKGGKRDGMPMGSGAYPYDSAYDPSQFPALSQFPPQAGAVPGVPVSVYPPVAAGAGAGAGRPVNARAPGYNRPFKQYSRETLVSIVDSLNSAGFNKPESVEKCPNPSNSILRPNPLTEKEFTLLEPFPVIYPASPSPQLAAQPHHSGAGLPFLDLGAYAPYVDPNNPYAQPNASSAASAAPAAGNGKKRGSHSQAQSAAAAQPSSKPASSGPSQSSNSTNDSSSPSSTVLSSISSSPSAGSTAAPAAQPVKMNAAAIVKANQNKPIVSAKQIAAQKTPAPAAAPAAQPANTQSGNQKGQKGEKGQGKGQKGAKGKKGESNSDSLSTSAPATAAAPAVPTFASRVGALSPEEAAAKAAAVKAAREQKEAAAKKADGPSKKDGKDESHGQDKHHGEKHHEEKESQKERKPRQESSQAAASASVSAPTDSPAKSKPMSFADLLKRNGASPSNGNGAGNANAKTGKAN